MTPSEASNPMWERAGRVHDWRNHVPESVRLLWDGFDLIEQIALAEWAEDLADREHWE